MIIPEKLKRGDEIRIIAPSRSLSLSWITEDIKKIAIGRFKEIGYKISFGKNVNNINKFKSSSIEERISDFNDAFADKNVKAVITAIGGYNSIELLPYINYELVKKNPKIFCGYSDITAIQNAICTKSNLLTYNGPNFFDFGEELNFDFTLKNFIKCVSTKKPYVVPSSKKWSDDLWGKNQKKRKFFKNYGYSCITPGVGEGIIIGGNISTLQLLRGTDFWPKPKKYLLFIEADDNYDINYFSRNFVSILIDKNFYNCSGIVIGRFQLGSKAKKKVVQEIIEEKSKFFHKKIPIIFNADFGHTTPKITFPIGGTAKIVSRKKLSKIEIIKH